LEDLDFVESWDLRPNSRFLASQRSSSPTRKSKMRNRKRRTPYKSVKSKVRSFRTRRRSPKKNKFISRNGTGRKFSKKINSISGKKNGKSLDTLGLIDFRYDIVHHYETCEQKG